MDCERKYQYRPLRGARSIRLATLLPGKPEHGLSPGEASDPLRFTIQKRDLNEADGKYEAVSYCWGGEKREHPIQCNGGVVTITTNLKLALLRFRHPSEPRTLWIDSICIDQDDVKERSHQVRFMGEIYARASRVLIWLGEEDETTGFAYSWIKDVSESPLAHKLCEPGRGIADLIEGLSTEQASHCLLADHLRPPVIEALLRLFYRQWFSRAWVYQESILARYVIVSCGTFAIADWRIKIAIEFLLAISISGGLRSTELTQVVVKATIKVKPFFVPLFVDSNRQLANRSQYFGLLRALLEMRRGADVSDPRDVVFSLLCVAACGGPTPVYPDYAIPWEEVYSSITRRIILETSCLTIFNDIIDLQRNASLPSWVPDWRKSALRVSLRNCRATGSSTTRIGRSIDPKRLVTRGLLAARVDHVQRTGTFSEDDNLMRFLTSTDRYPPTGESMRQAYKGVHNDLFGEITGELSDATYTLRDLHRDVGRMCEKSLEHFGSSPTLILTSTGHMGGTPAGASVDVGDHIFLLLGSPMPTILRQDGDEYRFVSQCYIHGLMNGEGLEAARARADPDFDPADRSWLDRLHEGDLPFETEEVVLK